MSTLTERWFAERLNRVWFKYDKPSRLVRLGKFLTDLLNKVNELITRVDKLEGKSAIQTSSMNRTATGVAAMNSNWDVPRMRTLVPQTATALAAQMVTDFQNGNSTRAVLIHSGIKITVERW
jgi:hypothetical protein